MSFTEKYELRATGVLPLYYAGRPLKLTPARKARLLEAISKGAARKFACKYAGIGPRTFREWVERGWLDREHDPPINSVYAELVTDMEVAEGQAVVHWLDQIEQAANEGQWQAAAWRLERLYPESYGRRQVVDVNQQAKVEVYHDALTHQILTNPDAIDAACELIARLASGSANSPDDPGGLRLVGESETLEIGAPPATDQPDPDGSGRPQSEPGDPEPPAETWEERTVQ